MQELVKLIDEEICKWRNSHYKKILEGAKPNDGTLYKMIRKVKNKKQTNNIAPLFTQKGFVFGEEEKINIIANKFMEINSMNDNTSTINFQKSILRETKKFVRTNKIEPNEVSLTSLKEVLTFLKKFNNNESPGID